jgi:membrane protein YqaA with SNARE-associated domain
MRDSVEEPAKTGSGPAHPIDGPRAGGRPAVGVHPRPHADAPTRLSPEEAERAAVEVAEAADVQLVAPARRTWQSILGMALGLLVLGGLSAAFLFYPIDWQVVGRWGYPGLFAVVLVATASIALPIPYLLIVARAGTHLDPTMIALVAGVAATLGEMTGYLIGISGSRVIPHGRMYERARSWICGYGFWCIAFFSCVPNPVFDAVGIAAGALGYSPWKFAIACFIGKAIRFFIAALIGVQAVEHGWMR